MKTLALMRHAKSDWRQGFEDRDRPLNTRGRLSSALMAAYLREIGVQFDHVLCSPSARTRETLERLNEMPIFSSQPVVEYKDELYLASANVIDTVVCALPEESNCVLILAHEPGISAYASQTANEWLRFPTAAIALFRASAWSEFQHRAALQRYACPKGLV